MGVPSFYRWLVKKYPNVVVNAKEEKGESVDTSLPNPNGEYDNLYLDMNGIIHPCFHPENHPSPPTTFQEVFDNIYEYIDRLFAIVRPRKLLYMAIDGVAPRAKMNQQRSRRFRTAKDNQIAEEEEERLRAEFEMAGKPVLLKQLESEVSDSNIITPGTVFMDELSKALQSYVNQRLKNDVGWKNITVILSDANVPGEGEHKIMSFIRLQRTFPGYNPNTRHCLYGLDADLIMLALATHEVHFSILREDIMVQDQQLHCQSAIESSLDKADQSRLLDSRHKQSWSAGRSSTSFRKKPYQFLHVWILREYLELDLNILDPPDKVKIDLESLVDDFIFMCFFNGNDFLPHMPTLEIHEGAIDLLMHVYRKEFKNLGGYLVNVRAGDKKARCVELKRVEKFILLVGSYEEKIFKKRSDLRERLLKKIASQYLDDQKEKEDAQVQVHGLELGRDMISVDWGNSQSAANGKVPTSKSVGANSVKSSEILHNTKELKEKLKSCVRDKSDLFKSGNFAVDKVKLAAAEGKERYYEEKFSAKTKDDRETTRKNVVQKYTEGLCWVLEYYFSEVPSWTWFYPYHYGPFASDLRGISQVKVSFQKGSPFSPFDQLMGVLPPRSAHALPRAYRGLMSSEESKIIDFYPNEFELDVDGKRFLWQAVCKLSFIEEERLLSQTKILEGDLQEEEAERNKMKVDLLFVRSSNELGSQICSLYNKLLPGKQTELKESMAKDLSGGIGGIISPCDKVLSTINCASGSSFKCPQDSHEEDVLCVRYELPCGFCQYVPHLLDGVQPPEKTITEADIVETQLWHECWGSRPSYRLPLQRNYINEQNAGKSMNGGRGKPCDIASGSVEHSRSSTNSPAGHGGRLASAFSSSGGPRQPRNPNSSSKVFDCGRGKPYYNNTFCSAEYSQRSSSNFSVGRGEGQQRSYPSWSGSLQNPHPVMSATYRGTYNLNEKWKPVGDSRQVESARMEHLRISESRQGFKSYGGAQPVGNNFRPVRNSSGGDRNYELMQFAEPAATPTGQLGWDRGLNASTANRSHAWQPNHSVVQAHGKGQYVPKAPPTNWYLRDSSSSRTSTGTETYYQRR